MARQTTQERQVEVVAAEIETVRIRVLPGGRMDSNNAAKYLGRAPKTLAMWRIQKKGPKWTKSGGRVNYYKDWLDAFIRGEVA